MPQLESSIKDNTEEIGKHAATLSLIEIGLGSFLHSFNIPLAGHLLSLNQIALLSRSCYKLNSTQASLQISLISSLLKSLSPAGKKLTPMLAIAAQGVLYYLGLFIFGLNYAGLFVSTLLSSLWAFIQPVLFIYLLFGKNSIAVAEYYLREFGKFYPNADQLIFKILIGFIFLKFILAYCISLWAIRISDIHFNKYRQKMLLEIKETPKYSSHSNALLAMKDLLNPLFLISFFMTVLFFIFSQSSLSVVQTIWLLLRPIAVGYLIFYMIRVYPVENLSAFLHRKGFTQMGKILDVAIKVVQESRGL